MPDMVTCNWIVRVKRDQQPWDRRRRVHESTNCLLFSWGEREAQLFVRLHWGTRSLPLSSRLPVCQSAVTRGSPRLGSRVPGGGAGLGWRLSDGGALQRYAAGRGARWRWGEREGTTVIYYVMHARKKDGLGSGGSRGQSASSKMLSCKVVCG